MFGPSTLPGATPLLHQTKPGNSADDFVSLHRRLNLTGENIGMAGFDPVTYFPAGGGRPQRGLIRLSVEHAGVTYRFANEKDRDLFQKDPSRYLPAYGGWCAWAVGELGKRVDVDPESFELRDGRLFLFYRDPELDTRALWSANAAHLITKAEANYSALTR
jgi:hypothetical protein